MSANTKKHFFVGKITDGGPRMDTHYVGMVILIFINHKVVYLSAVLPRRSYRTEVFIN
jgi:hypothetical protein